MSLLATEADLRSVMIRALHGWWRDKSAGDIPDRADLEPGDIRRLLPNLFIADVEHAPFRIRYRLMGTRAVEATGMDLTGRYLDELLSSDFGEPWMDHYHRAYRTRRPVFGTCEVMTTTGGRFTYEFGLFPLRKGGTAVDQFVALEDYFDLSATLQELVEWREKAPAADWRQKTGS